jgi:hypothetical protein
MRARQLPALAFRTYGDGTHVKMFAPRFPEAALRPAWQEAEVLAHAPAEPSIPILVVNPGDDDEFRHVAEELVAFLDTPIELQTALRRTYPEAVVRPRGLEGEAVPTWYVFRDGHWTATGSWRE